MIIILQSLPQTSPSCTQTHWTHYCTVPKTASPLTPHLITLVGLLLSFLRMRYGWYSAGIITTVKQLIKYWNDLQELHGAAVLWLWVPPPTSPTNSPTPSSRTPQTWQYSSNEESAHVTGRAGRTSPHTPSQCSEWPMLRLTGCEIFWIYPWMRYSPSWFLSLLEIALLIHQTCSTSLVMREKQIKTTMRWYSG